MWTGCLVALLCCSLLEGKQFETSLNGDDWTISDSQGRVKDLPATVPGQVHLDLLRHKVIEDPYYGYNDVNYRWIAYSNWTYSLRFKLARELLQQRPFQSMDPMFLKFDGLDTVANISLNGKLLGYTNSYHRRWLFNLTGVVNSDGENTLQVVFESAASYSMRKAREYPYVLLNENDGYIPDTARNFIRKPQSDFGWDWGPSFVPTGIWQNVSIVSFDAAMLTDHVVLPYYNATADVWTVTWRVCFLVDGSMSTYYNFKSVFVGTSIPITDRLSFTGHQEINPLTPGKICANFVSQEQLQGSAMDPYIWWPYSSVHTTPKLFNASLSVTSFDYAQNVSVVLVSATKRTGFRSIELVQEPPPNNESGLLFYFAQRTSKQRFPLYAKGSNLIPIDAFVNRATPSVARRLLESALEGNQNMIRIWGGGLYQPDWLYDMCDEMGLMVWQEFMFAVAQYPRDLDFLANVREEARHQIRRLAHHPSIVLWSGNNENQALELFKYMDVVDYSALYDQTIRATLWEEDNTRPYWPSSPSNGILVDDMVRGMYIQRWGDPSDPTHGDIHRYDYNDLCTDVSKFPHPRFASEFGFQAYPAFYSMSQISKPEDWDNNSTFMNHRQHHPKGNKQLADMMALFFHPPNNTNKTQQFMDFIYLTQVVQAICIGGQAEHYRRLLSESGAYTRGTLYWQLNDIWQAQTWASVEYSGRWKLLHYAMKKVYAEVTVSAYQLSGNVVVYVALDQAELSLSCQLTVDTISWSSGQVVKTITSQNLDIGGFTGKQIWSKPISEVFPSSPEDGFLHMKVVKSGQGTVAEGYFFPISFSKVTLKDPKIAISNVTTPLSTRVQFTLRSAEVAPYVMLDSGALEGIFSDNGMLMLPNTDYKMYFTSWNPFTGDDFTSNLLIRTVWGTYQHS